MRFAIQEKGSFDFRNPFREHDLTVEIGSYKRRWVAMYSSLIIILNFWRRIVEQQKIPYLFATL
jgi:hypothetical protein